jgi:hypothetical protein
VTYIFCCLCSFVLNYISWAGHFIMHMKLMTTAIKCLCLLLKRNLVVTIFHTSIPGTESCSYNIFLAVKFILQLILLKCSYCTSLELPYNYHLHMCDRGLPKLRRKRWCRGGSWRLLVTLAGLEAWWESCRSSFSVPSFTSVSSTHEDRIFSWAIDLQYIALSIVDAHKWVSAKKMHAHK